MQARPAILPAPPRILLRNDVPNILVADDNPVSLRFFAEALAQLGFACELAREGLETVAEAKRTRFDLLLLDARMPGLDGVQALARIRSAPGPSRDTAALATTADASEATRRDLVDAGFVEVITKPVTVSALRAALARHLAEPTPQAPSPAGPDEENELDDAGALAVTGGDVSILAALRGLLMRELDALPAELADIAVRENPAALRDRLHRLDASAGFCGAPALVGAGAKLRSALDAANEWPHAAVKDFLVACANVRAALARSGVTPAG
jgi:CheY-like chemotaxis protein/HPt (histidine-containing phosphotransfer) domain-containing protein